MADFKQFLNKQAVVLDGALGTQLEARFQNILIDKGLNIHHHPLWSALILLNEPSLIQEIHYEYLLSGADMIMTATYQASKRGLQEHAGLTDQQVFDAYTNAINIAAGAQEKYRATDDRPTFLSASIGPYGAYLANGAEYTGDYSSISDPKELIDFHYDMTKAFLHDDRVDVLAYETVPNFEEAKQILNLIELIYPKEGKEKYFYLAFNFKNTEEICDGTKISEVLEYINDRVSKSEILQRNLISVGANCVKFHLSGDIMSNMAKSNELKLPLIAYPNAGLEYNLKTGSYTVSGVKKDVWGKVVEKWLDEGVCIIGGCCGSGPHDIAAIRETIHS